MAMDEETMVVLAIQLLALCCIAAALVVYLVCKVNRRRRTYDSEFPALDVGTGRSVLVTSCDTLFGIQLALHLTSLGFRVFAGVKTPAPAAGGPARPASSGGGRGSSEAVAILRAKLKQREAASAAAVVGGDGDGDGDEYAAAHAPHSGTLVTVPLDVTREDSLHEALEHVRRHLPAGEDGLWAVINTAGVCLKGKIEQQDSSQWETMFKVNVFGMLRAARTFMPLLKTKKGRLVTIGTGNEHKFGGGGGVVAYHAARYAVAGASYCLNQEMAVHGVRVVTIHTESIPSEKFFLLPKIPRCADEAKNVASDRYLRLGVSAVPNYALTVIEEALLVASPKEHYCIAKPTGFTNYLSAVTRKLENIRKKKYNLERTA